MVSRSVIEANARIVVRSFMSEPDALPLISAAAFAGQGWQENLMQPVTHGPKDHGSDGFLQWRLSRLDELQRRPNWDTLPVQVQFAKDECKRDYPQLWAQLRNPGERTIENLAANICDVFERPSKAGRVIDKRIAYAKRCYAMFATEQPKTEPPPVVVQNAKEPWSSGVGIILALIAWAVSKGVLPAAFGHAWVPYALLAGFAIFFIRLRAPAPAKPVPPPPMEKRKMDILKILSVIEALVPILEKVLADIPQIKADIDAIKAKVDAPDTSSAESKLDELLSKLNTLGVRQ